MGFDVFTGAVAPWVAVLVCATAKGVRQSVSVTAASKRFIGRIIQSARNFVWGEDERTVTNRSFMSGTSGWAYTIWKPEFYPKNVASKNFLKHYATQLNTVEVNYTFRRSLTEKAATGWMADVGPDFRFALKANQYITHIKRLQNVRRAGAALPGDAATAGEATRAGAVSAGSEFTKPTSACCATSSHCCREISRPPSSSATRHGSAMRSTRRSRDHNATLCVAETEKLRRPRFALPVTSTSASASRVTRPNEVKQLAERVGGASPMGWRRMRSSSTRKIRARR